MRRVVDVHTHIYFPRYIQLLKQRSRVPRIFAKDGQDRLIILPSEDTDASTRLGRPIGPEYVDLSVKKAFMDKHGIDVSVLSLANPWLDFLGDAAAEMASDLNKDLNVICEQDSRFYGFGVLPNNNAADCVDELKRVASLDKLRGVILGTYGVGKGLDDPRMLPVYETAAELGQVLFLHPHYGIQPEHYGSEPNGHVLPLALGFPFETTIAISRMILAGVFDKVPHLKILLAHSGGTVPFLAGRLDSCVKHDYHVRHKLQKPPSEYLKQLYYDAVAYHPPALKCVAELVGADRLMFGTDNPFFPPQDSVSARWESVDTNLAAIQSFDAKTANGILGGNAVQLLNLNEPNLNTC